MHTLLSVRKDEMLDSERDVQRLAKNVKEIYVGVDGVARRVKNVYIGVGGNAFSDMGRSVDEAVKAKPKSTNCPNCGAPVDIHAEKCAYCDTPYI